MSQLTLQILGRITIRRLRYLPFTIRRLLCSTIIWLPLLSLSEFDVDDIDEDYDGTACLNSLR